MCYAIPGKVVEISNNVVTIEYFGERKKARNEFYTLSLGDYIYAQGGLVIQQIPEREAQEILETWRDFFFQLQETDLRLTRETNDIFQIANATRQRYLGNACCVHGIIEFSNYCRSNCLYCGLRVDNQHLLRYRMKPDEILATCDFAVTELGFKALVFQSGEDLWYTDEILTDLVKKIRERYSILLILSIGEREFTTYHKLYEHGARGVLLRFETSNPELYAKLKPGYTLSSRLDLINRLRDLGYLVFTGFLIGLPEQTEKDILDDIHRVNSLSAEMVSCGPFIPHPDTPLNSIKPPAMDLVLSTIARTRIMYPEMKILVTTALETLDKETGARRGLSAGANSIMINLTPEKYRKLYEIYPSRAGTDEPVKKRIQDVLDLLRNLGRAPTDLGA